MNDFEDAHRVDDNGTIQPERRTPSSTKKEGCDHGVTFNKEEAQKLLGEYQPTTDLEFLMGNPKATELREKWPRLSGKCPKGCGFEGIAYASYEHYVLGDW